MVSRNTVLTWIRRGAPVLILATVVYISMLAGFGVWRTVAWLLIVSLVIEAAVSDQKMRKGHENFQKLFQKLKRIDEQKVNKNE